MSHEPYSQLICVWLHRPYPTADLGYKWAFQVITQLLVGSGVLAPSPSVWG